MKIINKILLMCFLVLFTTTSLDAASNLSGKKVKIGVLTDMSGPFSDYGGENGVIAVQMAIDDFKAKNNPDFEIELISADHQNKPDIASSVAREWLDSKQVDLITEMINSGAALAVSDLVNEKGKILIVTGAGSNALTEEACKPNTIHYGYDTYALPNVAAKSITKAGGKKWFFITTNYSFGQSLEEEAAKVVKANGGEVVGSVRHPFKTTDFTQYLLQAQASGADTIGLANAGTGMLSAIKQAKEFGISKNIQVVGLLTLIQDIKALGLESAQGTLYTAGFVWNRTPETTALSRRFFEKAGTMPSIAHAADYSSTMHYLNAVQAADSKDSKLILKKLKEMPVNDFLAENGKIREDGLFVHDMYLVKVKTPEESKEPWDLIKVIEVVPGNEAYPPLSESRCPLIMRK